MNKNLKEIAFRYFEGSATPEEEFVLFEFIQSNPDLMNEWEDEWKQTHIPSIDILTSLNTLKTKIMKHEKVNSLRRHWLKLSSAAAVLILISTIATLYVTRDNTADQLFTIHVPQGTTNHLSLPDGTEVWLNAGSVLSYHSDFNISSRNISLSGEAYFEVQHNEDLPFRITAKDCTFTVLGTKFNISAYNDDTDILAALIEGSLRFKSTNDNITMTPGDLVTYDYIAKQATQEHVDAHQYCSWINGLLKYDSISLPALLRRLSREYDVSIKLLTSDFDSRMFRISLTEAQNIESIMSGLCDILPIKVKFYDNCYHVYSK